MGLEAVGRGPGTRPGAWRAAPSPALGRISRGCATRWSGGPSPEGRAGAEVGATPTPNPGPGAEAEMQTVGVRLHGGSVKREVWGEAAPGSTPLGSVPSLWRWLWGCPAGRPGHRVSSEAAGRGAGGTITGPRAPRSRHRGPGPQARRRVSRPTPQPPLTPDPDGPAWPSHGSPRRLCSGARPPHSPGHGSAPDPGS